MRISTSQQYLQGIEAFGNQQSKLAQLQKQISSGVKLTKPSDNPAASSRVLELEQTVSLLGQYNVNITLAENRLKLEETTLNAVENAFYRIKELTIQASGIANDPSALNAIGLEINQRKEEILSLANTKDASGDYLFAGFQNQTQPFSNSRSGAIEHVVFNGDQGQRSFQISQTRQLTADDSGSKVFLEIPSAYGLKETTAGGNTGSGIIAPSKVFDTTAYTPGDYQIVFTAPGTYDVVDLSGPTNIVTGASYSDSAPIEFNGIRTSIVGAPAAGDSFTVSQGQYRDVFSTIDSIVDSLGQFSGSNPQLIDNLAQAQIDMENFFTNVLDIRTSIGGRMNALAAQADDNEAFTISTQTTISTLRDTDLAEAISQLTLEQTTLDAAQSIFARITSSSLFNFLR